MKPKKPPKNKVELSDIWIPFFEVFITATIGLVFFYPLKDPTVADITWIVGLLLMLNRVLGIHQAREALKRLESPLERMAEIVDVRDEFDLQTLRETLDAYLNITESEFKKVKEGILSEALVQLTKLRNDKRSDKLATSEYYEWLLPILEGVKKGENIKAVSCMFNAEWDDSPAEERFIKGNEDAALRGALVERIFVMNSTLLPQALAIEAIAKHCIEKQAATKLAGFYVERAKLEKAEPELSLRIAHGFIIFNSRVALIDDFDEAGHVRGMVTMNEAEISGLEKTFHRLKVHAQPLSQNLLKPKLELTSTATSVPPALGAPSDKTALPDRTE